MNKDIVDDDTNDEPTPGKMRKPTTVVLQILFVAAGVVAASIGTAGLLGVAAIDAIGSLFLVGFGAIWVLGGIFKADVIEHML